MTDASLAIIETYQIEQVRQLVTSIYEAETNEDRKHIGDLMRGMAETARRMGMRGVHTEASVGVAVAEREIVKHTPRVGSGGDRTQSNTGVTLPDAERMELSRMRPTHEDVSDEQFEAVVAEAIETQTPLTRAKIKERQPRPPSDRHPATYTAGLLPMFRDMIVAHHRSDSPQLTILDPMAGEDGIFGLDDLLRPMLRGRSPLIHASDLVRWQHADSRVVVADATSLHHKDGTIDVMVTSPPYGNRMADKISKDGDNRVNYADRRGEDAGDRDATGLHWHKGALLIEAGTWVM